MLTRDARSPRRGAPDLRDVSVVVARNAARVPGTPHHAPRPEGSARIRTQPGVLRRRGRHRLLGDHAIAVVDGGYRISRHSNARWRQRILWPRLWPVARVAGADA